MSRPARVSPDRILAAAAVEFAERGYSGARVDRIARRARVNKAMLYYHFGSKEALYRALLRQVFTRAGERLGAIARSDGPAAEKLDRALEAIADFVDEHAFFPAIMLREIAEGGARLDRETLGALATVPGACTAIVRQGAAECAFRNAHPMAAYFLMFAPIVMFFSSAPIRTKLARQKLFEAPPLAGESFVAFVQEALRKALAAPAAERVETRKRRSR